jgi:hypothetical protein
LTMVGDTLTMVEDTLTMVEDTLTMVEDTLTMVEDTLKVGCGTKTHLREEGSIFYESEICFSITEKTVCEVSTAFMYFRLPVTSSYILAFETAKTNGIASI